MMNEYVINRLKEIVEKNDGEVTIDLSVKGEDDSPVIHKEVRVFGLIDVLLDTNMGPVHIADIIQMKLSKVHADEFELMLLELIQLMDNHSRPFSSDEEFAYADGVDAALERLFEMKGINDYWASTFIYA